MLPPEVVLSSLAATLAMVATLGEELLSRDWKNLTHRASKSSLRLVCGLASHRTVAVWVALLSPHTFFTQVFQHLVNFRAGSLSSRQSMAPYISAE